MCLTSSAAFPTFALHLLCCSLQFGDLRGLAYTEEPNPHGNFHQQKMYDMRDVAARAIEVNGPDGENLALRQEREAKGKQRAAIEASMQQDRARKAQAFTPVCAAGKLCKKSGVHPDTRLPKTKVLQTFGLHAFDLDPGRECHMSPSPIPATHGSRL